MASNDNAGDDSGMKSIREVWCKNGSGCAANKADPGAFGNDNSAKKKLMDVTDPSSTDGDAKYWLKGGLTGLWETTRTDAEDCKKEVLCAPNKCINGKACINRFAGSDYQNANGQTLQGGDGFRFNGLVEINGWNNGDGADKPMLSIETAAPTPYDNGGNLRERIQLMVHWGNTVPVACGDLYSEEGDTPKNTEADWNAQRACVVEYWADLCFSCGMSVPQSYPPGSWTMYKAYNAHTSQGECTPETDCKNMFTSTCDVKSNWEYISKEDTDANNNCGLQSWQKGVCQMNGPDVPGNDPNPNNPGDDDDDDDNGDDDDSAHKIMISWIASIITAASLVSVLAN